MRVQLTGQYQSSHEREQNALFGLKLSTFTVLKQTVCSECTMNPRCKAGILSGQALGQDQRGSETSILGDIQHSTKRGPKQPELALCSAGNEPHSLQRSPPS